MKALLVSPRYPWPAHTGDRLRATVWLTALARDAEVSLVAPPGRAPADAPEIRHFAAHPSLRCVLPRLAAMRSLPAQCLLTAAFDWRTAIARARAEAGPFDVSIVLLTRTHPWVRDALDGPVVLDAIDSLRRNAGERARAAGLPARWLWRIEEGRLARLERDAATTYARVVFISEEERDDFGDAIAIGMGVPAAPRGGDRRAFDFGFWGRFPYFANADAVDWLLDEIWPAIRARRPDATMILGGADATRSLRTRAARSGVTLVSPIDDVAAFARSIRVAVIPVRYGTGQSIKILEAAEAGCAIVGTPAALRGLGALASIAAVASGVDDLVNAAVDLLADHDRRAAMADRLRDAVETHYPRSLTLERLAAVAAEAAA